MYLYSVPRTQVYEVLVLSIIVSQEHNANQEEEEGGKILFTLIDDQLSCQPEPDLQILQTYDSN